MSLKESKCEACTIDAPLVSDNEATELLKELNNWEIMQPTGVFHDGSDEQ